MSVFPKNFAKIYLCKCHGGGANFAPRVVADICKKNVLLDLKHL